MDDAAVRKGMADPHISKDEFRRRFFSRFYDAAFELLSAQLESAMEVAWSAYQAARKAPRTQAAGPGFADPKYRLSKEWIAARRAICEAQTLHEDPGAPSRVLIINSSPRNEHTCPGEMSKTYRLVEHARETLEGLGGLCTDVLVLSRLTAEYGRQIFPCKACFSTSPALCHWPCSCYPNHALGQTPDWVLQSLCDQPR